MTERERLIELIKEADNKCSATKQCENCIAFGKGQDCINFLIADYLLANGVIVLPCTPIAVMRDENEFDTDVFCPYCGTNLSGLYGEEPTRIVQCYVCGEYLDNTKAITKEEAERELEGERDE